MHSQVINIRLVAAQIVGLCEPLRSFGQAALESLAPTKAGLPTKELMFKVEQTLCHLDFERNIVCINSRQKQLVIYSNICKSNLGSKPYSTAVLTQN